MTQIQTLPSSWVEKIFARMQGIYGREFTAQYSTGMMNGIDAGLENAKHTWAEELGYLANNPQAIAYALEHLPERVPNCIKFKEICKNAPKPPEPQRIEYVMTAEQLEQNRQRIKDIMDGLSKQMSMKL